jgi:hypothetical protein
MSDNTAGERTADTGSDRTASEHGSLRRGVLSAAASIGAAVGVFSIGSGTASAKGATDPDTETGTDSGTGSSASGGTDSEPESQSPSEPTLAEMTDVEILNYALSLEHLETAYYTELLDTYSEHDIERSDAAKVFADAGSRYSTYQRFQTIRDQEAAHVEALRQTIMALGGDPVEPDEYDFPAGSVEESVSLAATIEAVGVSAYAGAAPAIDDGDVLAAALSIHSVEARHTAYLDVLDTDDPFPDAFDPALTAAEVTDIVAQYIVGADGSEASDEEGEAPQQGQLAIAGLQATTGSGDDPNSEYVEYINSGSGPLDLTGWTVSNKRGTTYTFPEGFSLDPDTTVRLYTGTGTETSDRLYWGQSGEVWDDRIDTMTVRDANGTVVLERSYP